MMLSRPIYVFTMILALVLMLALSAADSRRNLALSGSQTVISCHKVGQTVGHTAAMAGFDLVGLKPCIAEESGARRSDGDARPLPVQLSLEYYDTDTQAY
ncbi:hypothetical protein K8B33_08445 [Alcanivorax sp. JB21]|uniref:hypothetical protein n=1 Tax=Alcanivorax limicola TaxID=2874102 RepID=UPI001CBF2697|nr:hypothetical protein [Alcanivorax limicola]MBZ2189124.1 hypothetical protein [Alcanivorax limicola]